MEPLPETLLAPGATHGDALRRCPTEMPRSPLVVESSQGVVAGEAWHVEVVLEDHDVAHSVVLVEAPGRVGQDDRLHPQELEDAHGQGDLRRHNTKAAVNRCVCVCVR